MATTETGTLRILAKEQVIDDTPKVIKGLQFGVLLVVSDGGKEAESDGRPGQIKIS